MQTALADVLSAQPLDPTLALALAIHANPGAYALLLGSGVSRAAGIPTGWEVVLDLVQRLAHLEGKSTARSGTTDTTDTTDTTTTPVTGPMGDPAAWYAGRFGVAPEYSRVLAQLTRTSSERQALLRSYFEPTPDEREQGLKVPTAAHRAIAALIVSGHVRVILTTNFDQLLEVALRDAGITPAVLSTTDAIAGMVPLHLAPVTIIKLHGDYHDTRIKNTPDELAAYPRPLGRLLDRVLDEYGLVVAGWSASWDTALRAAILRCPSRRFATFWTHVGPLSTEAAQLVEHRRAVAILVAGADLFFGAVAEHVASLTTLRAPAPVTTEVAVATLKRYLPVAAHRIRLHDLVHDEAERVVRRVRRDTPQESSSTDSLTTLLGRHERSMTTLATMMATGAYFGESDHDVLWVQTLQRLGNVDLQRNPVDTTWAQLARYPAQLALFAAGIGAIAAGREDTLAALLLRPVLRVSSRETTTPAAALHAFAVVEHDWARALPGLERRRTPMSDHLHEVLQPALAGVLPDPEDYAIAFDHFEYLLALAFLGVKSKGKAELHYWLPLGRFAWRHAVDRPDGVIARIQAELAQQGTAWLFLRHGLFAGSTEYVLAAMTAINSARSRMPF